MAAIKTDSNQPVELDYAELIKRLDHIDAMTHRCEQMLTEVTFFIAEHKPALDRGMALLDPMAKVRALGKRK